MSVPDPSPVQAGEPASVVAAALRELDGLAQRPLVEHPDVYQRIHADLHRALDDIDDA